MKGLLDKSKAAVAGVGDKLKVGLLLDASLRT
jgi:hypothetical protein